LQDKSLRGYERMEGSDKRISRRRHLIYYSEVKEKGAGKLEGRLVDITTAGMMIVTEDKIEPDKLFEFEVVLPGRVGGKEKIGFKAKSRWCKKDVNPAYYATGFHIEEIDPDDRNIILGLINQYGFND